MKQHYLFYLAAGLMLLAIVDFPYGYYQLLRFIGFFAFAIAAYLSFSAKQQIAPFVLGLWLLYLILL